MGTMLQAANGGKGPSLDDYQGHEGCNEILSVSRADIVRSVHEAYLDVGVDCVETNTFGANFANLAEYGIEDRIEELAEAGTRIAREVVDERSTEDHPRWVIGSIGPGTKLPTLGHAPYAKLRDAYETQTRGMINGGAARGAGRDRAGPAAGQGRDQRGHAGQSRRPASTYPCCAMSPSRPPAPCCSARRSAPRSPRSSRSASTSSGSTARPDPRR